MILVQHNDFEATEKFQTIRDELQGHGIDNELDALYDALERFDFALARQQLSMITKVMDTGKGISDKNG